jgi:hypothetical protein
MHLGSDKFTIRGLMIMVVVVAGMVALPGGWRELAAVLSLPCLAIFVVPRLLRGGDRRLAAVYFWGPEIAVNVVFAAVCASAGVQSMALFLIWPFVILPTLAAFGATWAVLGLCPQAHKRQAVPGHGRHFMGKLRARSPSIAKLS